MILFEEKLVYIKNQVDVLAPRFRDTKGILTKDALCWFENGQKHSLFLDDVVGSSIFEANTASKMACFVVNTYPLVISQRWCKTFSQRKRLLREYKFACPDAETRSHWLRAIHNTLRALPVDGNQMAAPRRLQILLNPASGNKKAHSIFRQVRPLLERSYLHFTLTETTAPGHASKLIRGMALSEVDGLVLVGGDGTIHEAINGLMSRADWKTAIQKPIGVIPAGTGNGLCKTLLDISGEPYDPVSAAFLIAKGKERSLDLIMTEQNKHRYYSVLSLSWGIISDVDIESEWLRYMGSFRNNLYALMRICCLRTYRGRFSFLPYFEWEPYVQKECKLLAQDTSCSFEIARETKSSSMDVEETKKETSFMETEAESVDELSISLRLPTLDQSIPQNSEWQVIEDEFVLFWAMNTAWATSSIKAAPQAHICDGAIDVLVVRRRVSKFQLLTAFLRSSHGEHISLPCIEYYKVQDFRLEPLTSQGILAVDGERVNYSPIQMAVYKGLSRVMCH